ncbi:MAG TPA: M1 family metallopeptidase, partial [Kofleriaceae bacterium]|nr:M1 family metallopeptidase [Kofleriaceae bacterium]
MRRSVVALALVAACRPGHGPPRVQRLPKPDGSPALRGGGAPRSPRIANYKIEARFDSQRHRITGSETLTWTNTGGSPVDKLPFHLYLNAFKNEQSIFMRSSRGTMRGAHAADASWGWIQVDSLTIAGDELAPKLTYPDAPDETVAEVPLATPVQPGQTIEVAVRFSEQLPEVFARTGYKGEFHLVGQWFPKIGVRVGPPGAEQWECQPLHLNTEFFADFGTYDVTLEVPSTEVVAATGVLVAAQEAGGGMRTLTYHAEDVHDFVWMADPYMKVYSGQAKVENGTVEVRVLARPEQEHFARRHLEAAIGAIEKFSALFVPYPWPTMTVIDPPMDASAGAGGMEYPTLVTTAGDHALMRPGIRLPEYVTIHEVG